MQARTKAAAAAASVIPFACVICFDEFNTTERPPMVLPCGHTYVCLPCTKRLKRCMECREPLFIPAPKPPAPPSTSSSYSGGRFSPNPQPSTPTKQPKGEPTPLPIPKNVVLLALMESAERQSSFLKMKTNPKENANEKQDDDDDDDDETDDDEEEAFNLDHIITGMATLSGPCGTYAVREPEGLVLFKDDPRLLKPPQDEQEEDGPPESVLLPQITSEPTNSLLDEEKKQDDVTLEVVSADEEDTVVNFVLPNKNNQPAADDSMSSVEILCVGQKLQVVTFQDGIAKLARGRGYVQATSKQLVKVGGPVDEACRLEGLLDTVRSRGEDLEKTLEENNDIEDKLMRQLQEAQTREPAQPVISDPPTPEISNAEASTPTPDTPSTPPVERCMSTPEKSDAQDNRYHRQHNHVHREQFYTPRTDFGRYVQGGPRRAPHSPASIDNSDIMMLPSGPAMPRYGSSVSFEEQENHQPLGAGFACGVGLSLEGAEDLYRPQPSTPGWSRPYFRASSLTDHSTLTPSLTSSFDGVDFRTGLSGHRGLSHARKLSNSPKPRSHIRMMGEHRGISHIRASRRDSGGHGTPTTSSSSTLTILEHSPTFIPSTTTTSRPHSAVPALGPRFSSPSSGS